MEVKDIKGKVPFEIIESILSRGISTFTPPQEMAIKNGLLDGKNMVIASATASGKTLIAEIACINSIISKGKKAVYIAPMRALATEKYNEFSAAYPYIKGALSIGDLDSQDSWLASYSLIFASTEKFDSLIRHGIDWLGTVGCVVFDEVHMINDISRGPTLELLITRLKEATSAQIIALSASIGNAKELAEWINASIVESDFRPVKLKKGIVYNGAIYYEKEHITNKRHAFEEEKICDSNKPPEVCVAYDTLARGKQLLSFYSSRRNAEAATLRLASVSSERLTNEEKEKLLELSEQVKNILQNPTELCIKLANAVKSGIAFHHAGLLNEQRMLIENAFKSGLIKILCATTTLSLGLNLPAYTVLVKDTFRYDGNSNSPLSINEMVQLFGRAGRPRYDSEGRALLVAQSKEAVRNLSKRYFAGKLEPIYSTIGIAPVLRMHVLSFIAEGSINSEESINNFLSKTFYGYQYKGNSELSYIIKGVIKDLRNWDFIEGEDILRPTKLGKRVSELYIDPLSAKWIVEMLQTSRDEIANLFMIANTIEMRPYVKATEQAVADFVAFVNENNRIRQITEIYNDIDYGIYEPERVFAMAQMLQQWINEVREDEISSKYSIAPGQLYTKLTNASWIVYSCIELAKIMHVSSRDLVDLFVRLKYGIRSELLDLIRLEQVGRVRARVMFNNGIHTVNDIRENKEKVISLFGKEIAEKIINQLR
ncbi:MAG: DEAD/DEAH box helicase [Candidatus Micrarchaeaceae archaeon]